MEDVFVYDARLDMEVPTLTQEWHEYAREDRMRILERWETLRGNIPGIIDRFEAEIARLHAAQAEEEDWDQTVTLMNQINDYASRIADLNILFRMQPDVDSHHEVDDHHDAGEKF